jgi:hypothetical protein
MYIYRHEFQPEYLRCPLLDKFVESVGIGATAPESFVLTVHIEAVVLPTAEPPQLSPPTISNT